MASILDQVFDHEEALQLVTEAKKRQLPEPKSTKPIFLKILGPPIAKKRARFFKKGNYVGSYNPQETEEGRWMLEVMTQLPNHRSLIKGTLYLKITFIMPITKGWAKYKMQMLRDGEEIPHTKTPDLDNLIKFVKDCLTGVIWKDDSQVYQIMATKVYGLDPETIIVIGQK